MKIQSKIKAVKQEKSYGNLRLSSADFPGVKELDIKETLTLTVEVEVKGLRSPDNWEVSEGGAKPTDIFADVNIKNITLPKKKEEKDMD